MTRIPDADASSTPGLPQTTRAPEALARRKDELEMVLGAAGLGFCRVDEEGQVSGASSLFKALFGHAPDARLEWDDIEESLLAEDRGTLQPAIQAALAREEPLDVAVRTSWAEASPHWVFLRGRVVREDGTGRPTMLLVARDATEEIGFAPRDEAGTHHCGGESQLFQATRDRRSAV